MNAQEMWKVYSSEEKIQAEYDAWSFGMDADHLAALVDSGIKTATSSLKLWYDLEKEPLPQVGSYSILLDSAGNAVCVIRTDCVFIRPFREVDEEHAWKEGEGDRSLSYWRRTHEQFFREELETVGQSFGEDISVICEEFTKVYP